MFCIEYEILADEKTCILIKNTGGLVELLIARVFAHFL